MNAKTDLLFGPYETPALKVGDLTWCFLRDDDVIIHDWTIAPICWPLCRRVESPGFPGLLVDEVLARAIRQESAAAIRYWWGVSNFTVNKWRKALGVNRQNNEGSQILIHAATAKARDVAEEKGPSEEYRQKQRENAIRRGFGKMRPAVVWGIPWTPEHLALLGTMTDREVAVLTGHPLFSVKTKRPQLRIPGFGRRG